MAKDKDKGIEFLPTLPNKGDIELDRSSPTPIKSILEGNPTHLGELHDLYEYVSNPKVALFDKMNHLLKLQMYFSKNLLLSNEPDIVEFSQYRVHKEVLLDLENTITTLNEYSAGQTLDVSHPLFHKSVSFIIEALLIAVKDSSDSKIFDKVVRAVSIAMPGIEVRIKKLVENTSVEDILDMRSNPIMEKHAEEKELMQRYLDNKEDFEQWLAQKAL